SDCGCSAARKISRCSASAERPCSAARRLSRSTRIWSMFLTISCAMGQIDSIDSIPCKELTPERRREPGDRTGGPRSRDLRDEIGGGSDAAERGRLEQTAGVDVVLAHQIGDGARDLDQAIDAARGERAAVLDEVGEGALADTVEPAGRAQHGRW